MQENKPLDVLHRNKMLKNTFSSFQKDKNEVK